MVFDFKNNREEALRNGIEEKNYFSVIEPTMVSSGGVIENHVFRNFDTLTFEQNVHIENCVFENCRQITIDDSTVKNCEFSNSKFIYLCNTEACKLTFRDSASDADALVFLEDGKLSYCTFDNIKLLDGSYLCDGVGESWVEHCTFNNISTSRQDGEIINCEETVGKLFKKIKKYCIIDESSCKGLEQVKIVGKYGDEPKLPEYLIRGVEKGLVTQKQAEDLHNGDDCHEYDISAYDAEILDRPFITLDLRIPTFNCLSRAGFKTILDLVNLNVLQILQIPNIGNGSVAEIATRLEEWGLDNTAWEYFL